MNSSASAMPRISSATMIEIQTRLIDQEGGQRHIAAEDAADDDGDEEPAEAAHGAADIDFLRDIGAEAGLVLVRAGWRSGAAARRR